MRAWVWALAIGGAVASGVTFKQQGDNRNPLTYTEGDVIRLNPESWDVGALQIEYLTIFSVEVDYNGGPGFSYINGWYTLGTPVVTDGYVDAGTLKLWRPVRVARLGPLH